MLINDTSLINNLTNNMNSYDVNQRYVFDKQLDKTTRNVTMLTNDKQNNVDGR
jgi:hypothetical protein